MRGLQQLLITLLTCLPLALAVPPPQWRDGQHQAVSPSSRRSLKEDNATVYECQDMVLGINAGFFDVLNSIRANHGAAPVELDYNLTVAAKDYLADNNVCSNQFAPPPYFNETEGVIGLGVVLLGDLLASNWRCVQVLNQWFLTARDYDYDNPFESRKPAADPDTYVKLAFTTMIWNSTELVGCAMIDCPQPKHVEVMCMFKDSSGYLPTFENLGPSQNEIIAEHINPPADKCPSPYSSKIGDTAESVGDKYNLTAVDVTCFGRQIGPFVQIGLGSVPLTIPCPGMAPKTCSEYDFVNNILPTTYIVTPDDTFSSVGQRFGLSGDDICCYNGYYNISLFNFCKPPALENYNSIITIPSPKELKVRGCNAESLKHNGKPWACPDVPDFMYIMNQYRAVNGLSNMTWDDRLQTEVLEFLNRNPVACDNPFAVNTPNGLAIMPSSSNTETKCTAALPVVWGNLMDQSSAFELWERPDEYDNQASPYTKLLGKNATDSVGCGLMTCNPYMSYIFCLFSETIELNNGQPIESNDADDLDWQLDLGKPKDCPTYVFTAEGQTIQEVAAENNVTVQQLVCYGETFRDMDAFRVKFSYGFPVLIPCKDALPKDVTCNTWKWYKGQCGGNYTTLGGDTMQGVASRYLRNASDPTSNMTSAELCCFNRGTDALKNEGNCTLEPAHILRIPCGSDLEQSGCLAAEFKTEEGVTVAALAVLELPESCIELVPDYFNLHWEVSDKNVTLGFEGRVDDFTWLSFGFSAPSSGGPLMVGSDVVIVGSIDQECFAKDYYLKEQISCDEDPTFPGVCQDSVFGKSPSVNNVQLLGCELKDGILKVVSTRTLAAHDEWDSEWPDQQSGRFAIWGIGPLDPTSTLEDPKVREHLGLELPDGHGDEPLYGGMEMNLGTVQSSCQVLSADDSVDESGASNATVIGPDVTIFNVTLGPNDAYPDGSTLELVYIINGYQTPTLNVIRGETVTFNVITDCPFYISSGAGTAESSSTDAGAVYAGGYDLVGTEDQPYSLDWTIPQSAPPTLYYHCYTVGNLGGLINVLSQGEEPVE